MLRDYQIEMKTRLMEAWKASPECDGADAYRYGQDTFAGICGQ